MNLLGQYLYMRSIIAIAFLFIAHGSPASAGTASTQVLAQQKRIASMEERRTTLIASKRAAKKLLDNQLQQLKTLQVQKPSWNRDRQLRNAKSKLHRTTEALAAKDRQLDVLDQQLVSSKSQLVYLVEQWLAREDLDKESRAYLTLVRNDMRKKLRRGPQPIKLPIAVIDPLADAEELRAQAGLIYQAEQALIREERQLNRLGRKLQKRQRLRRQHRRANDFDLFGDNQPRRLLARTDSRKATEGTGDSPADPGKDSDTRENDFPNPEADAVSDEISSPTPQQPSANDVAEQARIVLRDVVNTRDLNILEKAMRLENPKDRLRAIRNVLKQVRAQRKQLRQRRSTIEKRANLLSR